jgi:hypothetical protein
MQNRHHANATADIMGIGCQLENRVGGGLDEQTVNVFLMPARKCPQLMRQRKYHMIIRYRQEFLLPRVEPRLGLVLVALRTTSVTAGVIRILLSAAVIAFEYVASHRGRTTSEYILECTSMTGWHSFTEGVEVLRAVASQDIGNFDHGGCPADQSCRMISLIFFWTSTIVL